MPDSWCTTPQQQQQNSNILLYATWKGGTTIDAHGWKRIVFHLPLRPCRLAYQWRCCWSHTNDDLEWSSTKADTTIHNSTHHWLVFPRWHSDEIRDMTVHDPWDKEHGRNHTINVSSYCQQSSTINNIVICRVGPCIKRILYKIMDLPASSPTIDEKLRRSWTICISISREIIIVLVETPAREGKNNRRQNFTRWIYNSNITS